MVVLMYYYCVVTDIDPVVLYVRQDLIWKQRFDRVSGQPVGNAISVDLNTTILKLDVDHNRRSIYWIDKQFKVLLLMLQHITVSHHVQAL